MKNFKVSITLPNKVKCDLSIPLLIQPPEIMLNIQGKP